MTVAIVTVPLEQIIAEIEATPEGREELRQARIRLAQNLGPTYSGYERLMRGEGPPADCPTDKAGVSTV